MQIVSPPCWVRQLMNENLIWELPVSDKVLYLTFDDGPTTALTPWILETLKTFNAKATFFCVGNNIQNNPELFNQIKQAGHAIGNHTMQHEKGFKSDTAAYIKSILKCYELTQSRLFRPPHGQITPKQIKILSTKFKIIMWTVLTYDFDTTITVEQCLANAIKKTKAGSVVVFHDNIKAQDNLQYALPRFLDYFTKEGYSFHPIVL